MIEQTDLQQGQRIAQLASERNIGRTWRRDTGRVIVRHDDGSRMKVQRRTHDLPRVGACLGECALEHDARADQPIVAHAGGRIEQTARLHPLAQHAARDFEGRLKLERFRLAEARYLTQRLERGGKQAGKRAGAGQQLAPEFDGITALRPGAQQDGE
ncbi:unnamed protein product [Penicillium palitans]